MEFFHLEQEKTEDKIVSKEERIFADAMIFENGVAEKVKTKTFAPLLRIKFFLDVMEFEQEGKKRYVKIGRFYELENNQTARININNLFFDVIFLIRKEQEDFSFNLFCPDLHFKMYVSSVSFFDSFCNDDKGWLNPLNDKNIADHVEDDQFTFVEQDEFDFFKEETESHLETHDKEIEEEKQNRYTNDAKIISRIDFINEELQREYEQRKENDETLENKINQEIEERKKEDENINQRIDDLGKSDVTRKEFDDLSEIVKDDFEQLYSDINRNRDEIKENKIKVSGMDIQGDFECIIVKNCRSIGSFINFVIISTLNSTVNTREFIREIEKIEIVNDKEENLKDTYLKIYLKPILEEYHNTHLTVYSLREYEYTVQKKGE